LPALTPSSYQIENGDNTPPNATAPSSYVADANDVIAQNLTATKYPSYGVNKAEDNNYDNHRDESDNEDENEDESAYSDVEEDSTPIPLSAAGTSWHHGVQKVFRIIQIFGRKGKGQANAKEEATTARKDKTVLPKVARNNVEQPKGGKRGRKKGRHVSEVAQQKVRNQKKEVTREEELEKLQMEKMHELRSSLIQFRNPIFEDQHDDHAHNSKQRKQTTTMVGTLMKGVYKAKQPCDYMKMKETSCDKTKGVDISEFIKAGTRSKPDHWWRWVINQNSMVYQKFYLFTVFVMLCTCLILPYQFVFLPHEANTLVIHFFHIFVTCIYMVDILVSFHLTFIDESREMSTDLKAIAVHYRSNERFYEDLISAFPFDLFYVLFPALGPAMHFTKYLKIIKSIRLTKLSKLKQDLSANLLLVNIGRIVWVLVLFSVFIHFLACIWYQLSVFTEKYRDDNYSFVKTMLQSFQVEPEIDPTRSLADYVCEDDDDLQFISFISKNDDCFTKFRIYMLCLRTVMSILVQDAIDTRTEIECLFTVVVGMCGLVVGAVLVGQTSEIVANLHRDEAHYKNKLEDVATEMR
jgi:hypothetical protein